MDRNDGGDMFPPPGPPGGFKYNTGMQPAEPVSIQIHCSENLYISQVFYEIWVYVRFLLPMTQRF